MKKYLMTSVFALAILSMVFTACKKDLCFDLPPVNGTPATYEVKPQYSTLAEFKQGITAVVSLIQANNVIAYRDTLPNGYPNVNGAKAPLVQFGQTILEKLNGSQQQVESAVYDIFHFDEATFSLVSYLMKAQMAGNISYQTLVIIFARIPLPPFAVNNFQPPLQIIVNDPGTGNCCTNNVCNPQVKILVTTVFKAPCGNYEKKNSGYAANNKLTHMSSGKMYRFDAEVTGCPCPGVWTSSVTTPAGASYGESGAGKTVTLFPVTSGTYTITFTYKVCDQTVTKTFTLQVD